MTTPPRRIRVAARLWQFVGVVGLMVAGLQIIKTMFHPCEPSFFNLIPFLAILACLFFVVSGSLVVRQRWPDILYPAAISVAAGFLAQLDAAAMVVARSLPASSVTVVNHLFRRPPADTYFLSVMGTLLLFAGLLALSRRREYRCQSRTRLGRTH